jgi:hypothetical protein
MTFFSAFAPHGFFDPVERGNAQECLRGNPFTPLRKSTGCVATKKAAERVVDGAKAYRPKQGRFY